MNNWTAATWLWEFAWQSTLCLCLGGAISLVWNRWPARGHRVLVLAIAACFVTPVLTLQVRRMGWGLIPADSIAKTDAARPLPAVSTVSASTSASPLPAAAPAAGTPPTSVAVSPNVPVVPNTNAGSYELLLAEQFNWKVCALLGWAVVSAFTLARLLASVGKGALVLCGAGAMGETEVRFTLQRAVARLGLKVEPRLLVSTRVSSPVICCWGSRPAIIIPDPGPEFSRDNAWTGILSHELAHWKRRDHYAALLGELLICCLPWHPLAWWARRRMSQLSELACDRWVLACGQPAEVYADSLLDLVPQHKSAFVLPALGAKKHLQGRIRSILSAHQPAASMGWAWACTTAIVALLMAGTIAFAQSRGTSADAGWQLSKKDSAQSQSGLGLRLLVKGGGASDFSSCPSADGRYVCDIDRDHDWELCVRDRVSGKSRLLTKNSGKAGGGIYGGMISPDNKCVAYSWYRTNTYISDELRLVNFDGSGMRLLYTSPNTNWVTPLRWSSDGRKILIRVTGDPAEGEAKGTSQLLLVSAADGSAEVLKTLPAHSSLAGLSPDCRYIAYDFPQRGSTNACDVFLYDTRDKREIPLITHAADDRFLGWSLDGKWIVFSSNRPGTVDLWLVQVGDAKAVDAPRLIKNDIGKINPKGFTRDGSFYYNREFRSSDVYIASFDLEKGSLQDAPVPLPVLGDKECPAWSHDGQFLAFSKVQRQTSGNESSTVAIYSLANGEVREFNTGESQPDVENIIWLRWSSDDRFIFAGIGREHGSGIYQIEVASGRSTLAVSNPGEGKPRVISTAKEVNPEPGAMVREYEAIRKRLQEIAPEASKHVVSPDKKSVAFVGPDWRIMVMAMDGGVPREVVPATPGNKNYLNPWLSPFLWTPDGRDLIFPRSEKEGMSLWKVSAGGGPSRKLWVTSLQLGKADIHPDGRRMALDTTRFLQHEVWVVENLLPNN